MVTNRYQILGPQRSNVRRISEDFDKLMRERVRERTAREIRQIVAPVVDRTMLRVFQYMANQMRGGTNFQASAFRKYLPRGWAPLDPLYMSRKGNERFFSKSGELAREFNRITLGDFLAAAGRTQVIVSRDHSRITVEIVPDIRIIKVGLEHQLSGLLSQNAMYKLENRKGAYRALVGPAFEYFARERVPRAIREALAR